MATETKNVVRTENAPGPFQGAPYSQAIQAGGFVFVSGQLGLELGQSEIAGSIGSSRPRSSSPTSATSRR